ncbi:MAG: hypothetical protein ACQERD_12075 [Campylobacterota bacterium]
MSNEELIASSNFIITFGTMLSDNKEDIKDSILKSISKENTKFVYMHPIDNIDLKMFYTQFTKYEVGSEEGVCALLLDTFVKDCDDEKLKEFIDDLDLGYISAESSAGEEEFEEAYFQSENCKVKTLIVGDDLLEHERLENIVKMLSAIKKYSTLNVIALNESLQKKIDSCNDFALEEVQELKSFNGTLLYRLEDEKDNDILICSKSFATIAKVQDKDEIFVNFEDEKIKRTIKVDDDLTGTISIAKVSKSQKSLFSNYRYKQVKIEKVDAQ